MRAPFISGITQACVVVPDFDRALAGWARLGVGPFKTWTFADPKCFATVVRGRPTPWSVRLGATWCGEVELEVIQPLSAPSLAAEFLAAGGHGVQHLMGQPTTAFGRAVTHLEASGYSIAESGTLNVGGQLGPITIPPLPRSMAARFGTHFAYFDTRDTLGAGFELVRFPPGLSNRLAMRIAKADAWAPAGGPGTGAGLRGALLGRIQSVGLIVPNPRETAARWEELLGIGPWDEADAGEARLLFAQIGKTRVELTEPAGALAELSVPGGYVGFAISLSLDTAVRRLMDLGARELGRGEFLGRPRAFVDGVDVCGSVLVVER